MRRRFLSDVRSLAARALSSGGRKTGPLTVEWDLAGNCEQSYLTVISARPSQWRDRADKTIVVRPGNEVPLHVEVLTRCRRCGSCLTARRRLWTHRAAAETRLWGRTWFGTITLSPDNQHRMVSQARAHMHRQGLDYDQLSAEDRFRQLDSHIWRELSLMLKRIRKGYNGTLRHFIVCEQHTSGLPHYHALIHECQREHPLTYRHLEGQWPLGFTKWRLVKSVQEATYVAKYLNKSSLARVRASQYYGEAVLTQSELSERENIPETDGISDTKTTLSSPVGERDTVLWLTENEHGE